LFQARNFHFYKTAVVDDDQERDLVAHGWDDVKTIIEKPSGKRRSKRQNGRMGKRSWPSRRARMFRRGRKCAFTFAAHTGADEL
jgi:hypothetical protein